ncbi:hypothetical protein [Alteribacter populi]|uniref:hypothetical protein n=1 Tax=Alteribacter populi TaxID=2011011 RepID=UPI000BBACBFD|nr:hypothetical protein [Alteribacter populi]
MIDKQYLDRFGERRFEEFQYGQELSSYKLPMTPIAYIDMDFLKQHEQLAEWDSFLFQIFSSVERIYRVDFNSKYYFHSVSPTAKNIPSVKLIMSYQGHLYMLNPLLDKIEVSKNTFISGLEENKMYLILLSDGRKLQIDYGEFYKMLSMLNIGHALMNVESILTNQGVRYKHVNGECSLKLEEVDYMSIPIVLEVRKEEGQLSDIHTAPALIADPFEQFQLRVSNQSLSGDVLFNRTLEKEKMDELIFQLNGLVRKTKVEVSLFINDVYGYKSGYYRYDNGKLIKKTGNCNKMEPNKILEEYKAYTNITGLNMWFFFHFNKKENVKSFSQFFVDMGYIGQYISLYAGKWGIASRGMKNYNDEYLKEYLDLKKEDLIGYSLMVFPRSGSSHSSFLDL